MYLKELTRLRSPKEKLLAIVVTDMQRCRLQVTSQELKTFKTYTAETEVQLRQVHFTHKSAGADPSKFAAFCLSSSMFKVSEASVLRRC